MLAGFVLFLCASSPVFATSCSGSWCNCDTLITVDPESSLPCDSIRNTTCKSLQGALDTVAGGSSFNTNSCVAVQLLPGRHVLDKRITITQSIALFGSDPVPSSTSTFPGQLPQGNVDTTHYSATVLFNISTGDNQCSDISPFYILSFIGGHWLSISSIEIAGSPGTIEIVDVTNVHITNSTFSSFCQGALDIYNCNQVSVINCDFVDNGPVSVVKSQMFRGHSAGLSLGYDILSPNNGNHTASIEYCFFFNNSAEMNIPITQEVGEAIFPGRGGGLSILINSISPVSVEIINSIFLRNSAALFGGGIYVTLTNHLITFQSCDFIDNWSETHGGGLHIDVVKNSNYSSDGILQVNDCSFNQNSAQYGGAAYILFDIGPLYDGSKAIHVMNSVFDGNHATEIGAAVGVASRDFFVNMEQAIPLEITDCSFKHNNVPRGAAVATAFYPVSFSGFNFFQDNRGPSLAVIGSVLRVSGEVQFQNNNLMGLSGGTLYLLSQGQMVLSPHTHIVFLNNRGVLGSATVVEPLRVPDVFANVVSNNLCFLRFQDSSLSPLEWHHHNVSVEYKRNMAIVGSAIYTDSFKQCSWYSNNPPYFSLQETFHWPFISFEGNDNRAHRPNNTDQKWAAQTPAFNVDITTNIVSGFAGDDIPLGVESYDELGETTPVIIRLTSDHSGQELLKFSPSTINHDRLDEKEVTTSFLQLTGSELMENQNITIDTLLTDTRNEDLRLTADSCPAGLALTMHPSLTDYSTCSCDLNHPHILDCDGREIIIQDGLWGFVDRSRSSVDDPLETYPCPPGHCRCELRTEGQLIHCRFEVDDRNFDDQCSCDRKGVLCGSCREGRGVTVLRKKCVTCHDGFISLTVGLVLCEVIVMLVLLLFVIPLPPSLLPCIFYIQILPLLTAYFPVTFENVQPFMLYVSSAIGLYFPYDFCVSKNMSPLVSHSLHYIPLLVAIITTPIVLSLRKLIRRPAPFHGLAWIIFLLYTPLLHTSMTALHCPSIRFDESRKPGPAYESLVWYLSGDQQCFQRGHIPLAVGAILVLIMLLATIPAVMTMSTHRMKSPRMSSHLLVAPFSHMYHDQWVWWSGVELIKRVVVVLFIVAFPSNDYPVLFLLIVIVTIQAYIRPYKHHIWNLLDLLMSVNVIILLLLRNTSYIEEALQVYSVKMKSDSGESNSIDVGSGGGNNGQDCNDEINGVTPFVILLAVIYYFPLLLSIVVAILLVINQLRVLFKDSKLPHVKSSKTSGEGDIALNTLPHSRSVRAPTTTTIDLEDLSIENNTDTAGDRVTSGSRKLYHWAHGFKRKISSSSFRKSLIPQTEVDVKLDGR